jgi:hypothetical protein
MSGAPFALTEPSEDQAAAGVARYSDAEIVEDVARRHRRHLAEPRTVAPVIDPIVAMASNDQIVSEVERRGIEHEFEYEFEDAFDRDDFVAKELAEAVRYGDPVAIERIVTSLIGPAAPGAFTYADSVACRPALRAEGGSPARRTTEPPEIGDGPGLGEAGVREAHAGARSALRAAPRTAEKEPPLAGGEFGAERRTAKQGDS